jgi:hypothetical protein
LKTNSSENLTKKASPFTLVCLYLISTSKRFICRSLSWPLIFILRKLVKPASLRKERMGLMWTPLSSLTFPCTISKSAKRLLASWLLHWWKYKLWAMVWQLKALSLWTRSSWLINSKWLQMCLSGKP